MKDKVVVFMLIRFVCPDSAVSVQKQHETSWQFGATAGVQESTV